MGKTYSKAEKEVLVAGVTNRSRSDCEQILAGLSPETPKREKVRLVSANDVEVRFTASRDLMDKLDKLRSLLSHTNPDTTLAGLLTAIADIAIKKLDPMNKPVRG